MLFASALDDKPLEEWAANGPFCKGKGSDHFAYLCTDEKLAYAALVDCLFSPRIEMQRLSVPTGKAANKADDRLKSCHNTSILGSGDRLKQCHTSAPAFINGDLVVTVHLPNFKTGQDVLDVRACVQKPEPHPGGPAIAMGPQEMLTPYCVKQICEDGAQVTAMQYFYRDTSYHQAFSCWHAKARIITADGPILPEPKRREKTGKVIDPKGKILEEPQKKEDESDEEFKQREDAYQAKLNIVDESVPGWVYADLAYREMQP